MPFHRIALLLVALLTAAAVQAQPRSVVVLPHVALADTADEDEGLWRELFPAELPEGHTPQGALHRSFVPGWGQYYNRDYYKLPFVYAGLGFLVRRAVVQARLAVLYRRASRYRQGLEDDDEDANPFARFEDAYREVLEREELDPGAAIASSTLRNQRDLHKRNRDFAIIGSGLFYVLVVADGYVSGHLARFDVGKDLSVAPAAGPGGNAGLAVRLRL